MYSVTKKIDFWYGHRLLDYDGICKHPHGHNAVAEIEVRTDTLDDRRVFVVGARSADDVTSPQFWVDAERLVTLRMIISTPTDSGPRVVDARLRNWVPVGGGWLATVVDISIGGSLVQKEEYSDWRGDVPLPDALFDPAQWSTAPHWAAGRNDKQ